jgi:hypothetical protein
MGRQDIDNVRHFPTHRPVSNAASTGAELLALEALAASEPSCAGVDEWNRRCKTSWCVYSALTMFTLGWLPLSPEGAMSIFWHLEHELMILRLAQLEEKIAAQREKLKRMSAYGPQARTAMRILEVREQSLQRSKAYISFIETKLAFALPSNLS